MLIEDERRAEYFEFEEFWLGHELQKEIAHACVTFLGKESFDGGIYGPGLRLPLVRPIEELRAAVRAAHDRRRLAEFSGAA